MSMEMRQEIRQEAKLNQEQKLKLEQLLQLEQTLKHPEIPEAKRGLKGMLAADELLKERGSVGLLMGGVAEALWKKGATVEDLEHCKDVDVLVLGRTFELKEEFEGGIDWWLPQKEIFEKIVDKYADTSTDVTVRWHENGNGIVLTYLTEFDGQGESPAAGLYIPTPYLITKIKITELLALAAAKGMIIEDFDVEEKASRKIRRRMTVKLVPEVKNQFKQKIANGDRLTIDEMNDDYYRAIINQ